jgi:hypothetical protein
MRALSVQGMTRVIRNREKVDNDATDEKDGGDVWLFVQDANVDTLKKLGISLFGGRRGKGADSST